MSREPLTLELGFSKAHKRTALVCSSQESIKRAALGARVAVVFSQCVLLLDANRNVFHNHDKRLFPLNIFRNDTETPKTRARGIEK